MFWEVHIPCTLHPLTNQAQDCLGNVYSPNIRPPTFEVCLALVGVLRYVSKAVPGC